MPAGDHEPAARRARPEVWTAPAMAAAAADKLVPADRSG